MFAFLVVSFLAAKDASVTAVVSISSREDLKSRRHIDRVDNVGASRDPLTFSVNVESEVVELDSASCAAAIVEDPVDDCEIVVR